VEILMSDNTAIFIRVDIDETVQTDKELCKLLIESCPVDIFQSSDSGGIETVESNLDECTLCDICVEAAPGKVDVVKLYRA
jgi:NAD-dependent dihydropyrimidine dehydrogenase PreA subunit